MPLAVVLVCGLVLISGGSWAEDPAGGSAAGVEVLGSVFPGVQLVRWQGRESRVVLRRENKLVVVHPGERLPEAGLLLRSVSEDRLVFETLDGAAGPSGVRLPEAVVVLSRSEDGTVVSQVFRRTPPEGSLLPLGMSFGTATAGSEGSLPAQPRAEAGSASGSRGTD